MSAVRSIGLMPRMAALLLALATTLHASEPAPRQPGYFDAPSLVPDARLDDPVDMKKNFQLDKGVLELRGPIDAAMRQRFQEMLGPEIRTVRITSQGGQIVEALRIAAIIQSREIDVVVKDFCLGACAQYIFVAGHQRRLEDQALVGFMYSIKSAANVLAVASETLEVRNSIEALMGRLAYEEEELYRKRGVDPALLVDPQLALQPTCVILKRNGEAIAWNTATNYLLWVPSREYLKAVGVEFEGDWARSRFTLGGTANRHLKIRYVVGVRYGDNDHLREKKEKPYSIDQLRRCVLEEETDASQQR
jgi:hypothetical protein